MKKPKVESATYLKDKFKKDLEELQKNCKHKKTGWCREEFAPAHPTGWEILVCESCWKVLKRRANCHQCQKEIIISEDRYHELGYLNPQSQQLCNKKCYEEFFKYK
jgi:hypothetical protein